MDFSTIFQLRTKKIWWVDVIFYFVISLLVATILCWVIFLIKNNMTRTQIEQENVALQTVGTQSQKDHESQVIAYERKISDFYNLFQNHGFASNAFSFIQSQVIPNIWFKQFALDQKAATVQLSGESDDLDAFSRQVAVFEKSEYIKNVNTLGVSTGSLGKSEFNLALLLTPDIFTYLASTNLFAQSAPAEQAPSQGEGAAIPTALPLEVNQQSDQSAVPILSSEKNITSFKLLLTPAVTGRINQADHTITLSVPYGTDVTNLIPEIIISPKANLSPANLAAQNFTNPALYSITAEDNSVQTYLVRVDVEPQPEASRSHNSTRSILILAILVVIIITIVMGISLFLKRRAKE